MNSIQQNYFKKSRYFLKGVLGEIEISAPIGWNEDNKTLKRSDELHGIFTYLSADLQFYSGDDNNNGGYFFIKDTYDQQGINAVLSLTKEDDISGVWEEVYRGFFDFSTYIRTAEKISIKFNESGLYEFVKSRIREPLELSRDTTMSGATAITLPTKTIALEPRGILIIDEIVRTVGDGTPIYVGENPDYRKTIYNYEDYSEVWFRIRGPFYKRAVPFPTSIVITQSGNVQTIWSYDLGVDQATDGYSTTPQLVSSMFYSDSPDALDLQIDLDIEIKIPTNSSQLKTLRIDIVRYNGLDPMVYVNHTTYLTVASPVQGYKYTVNESAVLQMNVGDSLALSLYVEGYNGTWPNVEIHKANMLISDKLDIQATTAKVTLPFEALNKILNVISDRKDALKSKALNRLDLGAKEDGYAALTAITNGFWIRNFLDKDLTSSLDDLMKSFEAIWQIGFGIEKIGFKDYFRAEHISYFYDEAVKLKLVGRVDNITRTCAKDYFYSSLEVGYEKPNGTRLYDESQGLDEYNVRNNYTTAITKIRNKFTRVSPYRADSTGIEFARRKQYVQFPQSDTRYDLDVFAIDAKRGDGDILQRRVWEDDFIVPVPFNKFTTGTYTPEQATNLRFSPMNCVLRWGFWVKGGLMKNLADSIRYTSSEGNTLLATQLDEPGSIPIVENGTILNSDLEKNLFNPEIITFEYNVTNEIMKTLTGYTIVDGEAKMNYYGLIQFENENGELEYGYLLSLEPNGNGQWELLSSSRRPESNVNTGIPSEVLVPPTNLQGQQEKDPDPVKTFSNIFNNVFGRFTGSTVSKKFNNKFNNKF